MTVGELAGLLERLDPGRQVAIRAEWEGDEPADIDGRTVPFNPKAVVAWVDPDTAEDWALIVCDQEWDEEDG